MKECFEGERGRARLITALRDQTIVRHDAGVAAALADAGRLVELEPGETLVTEGDLGSAFYFVLAGGFDILVKGNRVQGRQPGDHVGEIAALEPGQKRTATVRAMETAVVLEVDGEDLRLIAQQNADVMEGIAREANKRLAERNDRESLRNAFPHVLAISAKEGLPIVREIESLLRDDDLVVRPWDQGGVFALSSYPIPSLQQAVQESDFALVVATPEDTTHTRGVDRPTPRDNVTFEMGMAVGAIGLDRTLVVTPSDRTELCTDANGVTVLRFRTDRDLSDALRPVANDLRKHIAMRGVRR